VLPPLPVTGVGSVASQYSVSSAESILESVAFPLVTMHAAPAMATTGTDGRAARSILSSVKLTSGQLAKDLTATRLYGKARTPGDIGSSSITLDVRFLLFEFLLGFVLRPRQYELVTTLVSRYWVFSNTTFLVITLIHRVRSAKAGKSSVQQMIMGQGFCFLNCLGNVCGVSLRLGARRQDYRHRAPVGDDVGGRTVACDYRSPLCIA
jgi:hypothetical protein